MGNCVSGRAVHSKVNMSNFDDVMTNDSLTLKRKKESDFKDVSNYSGY